VRGLLFVFEDILNLDDRALQMVLREVDAKDLGLAMRGASTEVQEKILSNMSQRGAEMLREEMEYMPPQRRKVVEEAQSKIVGIVRKLDDAGELVISRGGDEDDELIG
jgi:flagellar motor switch protein FliG